MKKKIEIEIPDGKQAKWVNNVLTLVDKDVTERIKTFEDACNELGEEHPLIQAYRQLLEIATCEDYVRETFGADTVSYLKLRIITAALNEGWEPQFVAGESRWYPWFSAIQGVLECTNANYAGSFSGAFHGVRLAFKSKELAEYAGKQFVNIYKDFLWKK